MVSYTEAFSPETVSTRTSTVIWDVQALMSEADRHSYLSSLSAEERAAVLVSDPSTLVHCGSVCAGGRGRS